MWDQHRRPAQPRRDRAIKRISDGRRGGMVMIFAAAFGMLLAFAGLTLDGGFLYYERQRAQAAADAGAYAGALELRRGSTAWIVPAAKEDAKLNGFDDDAADVVVNVNYPPVSGVYAGNMAYVEVTVQSLAPTTLLRIAGARASTVAARAVAGVTADFSSPCVVALDSAAGGALTVAPSATLEAPNCDVVTRSLANDSIVATGGGCIQARTIAFATGQGTTGGFSGGGSNCVSPAPVGAIPSEDPYASLAEPNPNASPLRAVSLTQIASGSTTLPPGYYKGGLEISGGSVSLDPGLYVVDGLHISGSASVSGENVTIYNTGDGLQSISIADTAYAELSATNDTGSALNNVLFFNSRNAVCGSGCAGSIAGSAQSTYEGAMYFPSVHLDYAGTQDPSEFSQIIARTIQFTGLSQINADWDAGDGRTPTTTRVSFAE